MNIVDVLSAGQVERYHTVFTLRRQNVGEHSWAVAQIIYFLEDDPSQALIRAALNHDLPEAETGDVPAPLKWGNKEITKELDRLEELWHKRNGTWNVLTPKEKSILKFADSMELVMFCIEEARRGNAPLLDMAQKGLEYIKSKSLYREHPRALELVALQSTKLAGAYK